MFIGNDFQIFYILCHTPHPSLHISDQCVRRKYTFKQNRDILRIVTLLFTLLLQSH